MKKYLYLFLTIFVLGIFASCSDFDLGENSRKATLTVGIPAKVLATTADSDAGDDGVKFSIKVSGDYSTYKEVILNQEEKGSSVVLEDIPVGANIKITVRFDSRKNVYSGSTEIKVKEGVNEVFIILKREDEVEDEVKIEIEYCTAAITWKER